MRKGLLLATSYVFYGWWDGRFCSLVMIGTVVDWSCGLGLAENAAAECYPIFKRQGAE